jgi:hypothetical protein
VAIIFSNFHFLVQNFGFRALFCRFTANQAEIRKKKIPKPYIKDPVSFLYSKNDIYIISTEKPLYQNVGEHFFCEILSHSKQFLASEKQLPNTKIQKISEIFTKP